VTEAEDRPHSDSIVPAQRKFKAVVPFNMPRADSVRKLVARSVVSPNSANRPTTEFGAAIDAEVRGAELA
jgi:hypothetical protein